MNKTEVLQTNLVAEYLEKRAHAGIPQNLGSLANIIDHATLVELDPAIQPVDKARALVEVRPDIHERIIPNRIPSKDSQPIGHGVSIHMSGVVDGRLVSASYTHSHKDGWILEKVAISEEESNLPFCEMPKNDDSTARLFLRDHIHTVSSYDEDGVREDEGIHSCPGTFTPAMMNATDHSSVITLQFSQADMDVDPVEVPPPALANPEDIRWTSPRALELKTNSYLEEMHRQGRLEVYDYYAEGLIRVGLKSGSLSFPRSLPAMSNPAQQGVVTGNDFPTDWA
jgi:hypothetical protein